MPRFSHLHVHSHYSLLSALPKIPELVKRAAEQDMPALALTDSGNLYGAIEFYKEARAHNIKPIIGIDAYVAQRSRHDKQSGIDSARSRIVLLAENNEGYQNLMKMVTKSYTEGFYYKPRIDEELMAEYGNGLIALIPAFGGVVNQSLSARDTDRARDICERLSSLFPSRLYGELTLHPELAGHEETTSSLSRFYQDMGIPEVAGHDIFYMNPEDKLARDTLLSVQSSGDRFERTALSGEDDDFSFISREEMEKRFSPYPHALHNVEEIVERCNVNLELGKWVFPDYKVESGNSYDDELRSLVYKGIARRGLSETPELKERIEYELSVIKAKGFSPYFLVVGDLLRHAHEHRILTNIRGSVAGSMVTYLAGITNVNPFEYQLPFERFLNPERPSAPDIDMDYADNRRDEMIDYVRKKYGEDKVAQIGTFGTMMARGSVRDVTRALGLSYEKGDSIAKLIPMGSQGFPMTIERALTMVPELEEAYTKDPDTRRIIDLSKKIEGCARHISVHAAGVVIAPSTITNFTPLQYDTKGDQKLITQYDMYSIEEAGLLKFDFLGLKNLSIIADTIERIEAIEHTSLDIETIPLDDPKTFSLLARGDTEGLFQLNGEAMTKFLMELKPSSIFDINAMVALYRPGPMQNIPDYIKRKHAPELVRYLDPALEPILSRSYGVLVYQDDLLMIAKDIAGYSWGEVDKFRKAVGKKIPEEMAAQKEKFIEGCMKHSQWPRAKALELWAWIEPFAAYGFNKAHAASYGRVAYQTAYLKANYPAIYMSAVLTADSGDVEQIGIFIEEAKRMNIPVLPPSVNESFAGFSVVREQGKEDTIRFGLTTIKNFGEGVARSIVKERKEHGRYTSLADFLKRVTDKNLNKKSLESLIKSGALDEFGERGALLHNMDLLLSFHKDASEAGSVHHSLFGALPDHDELRLVSSPAATMDDKLSWEKELLGLYLSGHPLDKYREKLLSRGSDIASLKKLPAGDSLHALAGLVKEVREVMTKKQEKMMFLKVEDLSGEIEVVIFPKTYTLFKDILTPDACLAFLGKISSRNNEKSLIAEKVKPMQ